MKLRLTIILLFIAFCFIPLSAQQEVKLGVILGGNSTFVRNEQQRGDWKLGLMGGIIADWRINDVVSVQPGLIFTPKGYDSFTIPSEGNRFDFSVRANYLDIPLRVVLRFDVVNNIRFFFDFGVYYAIGLYGKTTVDNIEWEQKFDTFGRGGNFEQWINYDMGFQVGAGFEFYDKIQLRGGYEHGLIRLPSNDPGKKYNQMVGVTLGYYIN